jgi:hypothetical protein
MGRKENGQEMIHFIWHQTCEKSAQKTFVHNGVYSYYKHMEMENHTTLTKPTKNNNYDRIQHSMKYLLPCAKIEMQCHTPNRNMLY